jgi:UDP-N-acetylglucosamine 2-epimerase (non-hydrolysing)
VKILVALGTRPEIVKLAVTVRLLREVADVTVVATGQHFDTDMTDVFFAELGVRPDIQFRLPRDPAARVGRILTDALRQLGTDRPDLVLVVGDTFTVPTYGLAARSLGIPFVHVEAGLRSFNLRSAEETNRRMGAAAAVLHFAPTELASTFLQREGVERQRIHVVGNPVLDTLRLRGVERRPPTARHGTLVTAHRASNVDNVERLAEFVTLLEQLAELAPPVLFPAHPRTVSRLRKAHLFGRLRWAGVEITEPLAYGEMLRHIAGASLVVTDSGGLQEEAAWYGVPAVVLRTSTPRWEGVTAGLATLVGMDSARAVAAARRALDHEVQEQVFRTPCPYGDGYTSERIVRVITDRRTVPLLSLDEPAYLDNRVPV